MNVSSIEFWKVARKWWLFRLRNGVVSGEPVAKHYTGEMFRVTFDIRGNEDHFVCFSNDTSITRAEAIAFCKFVHDGHFVLKTYDLSKL